jgi:hypothetical protein
VKLFCPSCGTAIEFRYDDSFVRVCAACRSAIVRTDRGIDSLGQFADLAAASSGLVLAAVGRYQGQPFELAGRAEYAHPAGGSWEEWYIKLADGRWAWLSHAHGQWAVTFRSALARPVPDFDQVAPGMQLTIGADPGVLLTVGERNQGTLRSAEGELPFVVAPGSVSHFVDLSDAKGRFATIDYGPAGSNAEPPVVYVGRRTSLEALGLRVALEDNHGEPTTAGERLGCPNCGGSIELRVPDRSLCVTCSYCGSLLDCEGPLAILARLGDVDKGHPSIALGARGTFEGVPYTVTGRLRRMARYDGGFVEWDEYLLYAPASGYRWLVCSRGHYSFVSPLAPGTVGLERDTNVSYGDRFFRIFDRGCAEVTGVWGEFYWKVALGETVQTADYVAPPGMLSRESSDAELHWSLGIYQTVAEVRRAFADPALPDETRGVAPHQPFRHAHWVPVAVSLAALLLVIVFVLRVTSGARQVYAGTFRLGSSEAPADDGASRAGSSGVSVSPYVFFTPAFELEARQNTSVKLALPLADDWAFATVDLVHEESGELRSYGAELSYYSGVEGGESWSEGSRENEHLFGAGSAGSHVLRLEVQTGTPSSQRLSISVAQDVFALGQLGWVLLSLAVPGGLIALAQFMFERARWSESDFAPNHYRSGSD